MENTKIQYQERYKISHLILEHTPREVDMDGRSEALNPVVCHFVTMSSLGVAATGDQSFFSCFEETARSRYSDDLGLGSGGREYFNNGYSTMAWPHHADL